MRVALLSDIHGNVVSLQAVLADLATRSVDRVVCLGDVAATGPRPREAIELIEQLGCSVVRGNTDRFLLEPEVEDVDDDDLRRILELDCWGSAQLEERHRAAIRRYQPVVQLDRLLCYHGSPRSDTEEIRSTTPEPKLAAMLAGRSAAVFAGGHTHTSMLRSTAAGLVINPGSVGMPYRVEPDGAVSNPPWAEYAIVDESRTEFVRVPVDVGRVAADALASGMPHAGWWVRDWAWQ